ncbi:MAG: sensor histidine kinase [Burkholderiales bacterium]
MIHSLRLRLLLWLLLPLTAFTLLGAWQSHHEAVRTAQRMTDHALLSSAQVIAGAIGWTDGRLQPSSPTAALELLASRANDEVYYFVATGNGRLLAGNPDFFLAAQFPGASPAWADLPFRGDVLRVVLKARTMVDGPLRQTVWVGVGQTTRSHARLVDDLWLPPLRRQVLTLLFAAALVLAGLTIELRPLLRLSRELADKSPMELAPIRAGSLHGELRPVVDAINQCIQRLNAQGLTQRRFIADAAHQLRTPLTLLDTQLQYAAQLGPDDGAAGVLEALHASSQSMIVLTNQLLMLAQAEAADAGAFLSRRIDLAALAIGVLEERAGPAQRKALDMGFDAPPARDAPVTVHGNPELVTAVVANLVDNAIQYGAPHGRVTVAVGAQGSYAVLSVTDDGPGMPPEARERAFERFFRHAAPDQPGTGLGLAIVKEIMARYGGTAELAPGPGGQGLRVTVRWPLASG